MKKNSGFIKAILLIIIALAILKIVWDFDVFDFLNNESTKEILDIFKEMREAFVDFIKSLWGNLTEKLKK